jgi:phosphoribosylanthranilate isomerase
LGASALGFNFFRPSPRYLEPGAARAIIGRLPPFVTAVGVFADEADGENVERVAREAGVAVIQLHGPRFPGPTPALENYPLIRAVAVKGDFRPADLARLKANAFLLDAFDAAVPGGTGRTFDWRLAREAKPYGTIILAGGLTPENVGEAIRAARSFAVDVASGVESTPGKKDPARLRAFFAAARKVE